MVIIAFSTNTSKILPKIVCRRFRHVALITSNGDDGRMILWQFVRPGHVAQVRLRSRDLGVLRHNGWHFIYLTGTTVRDMRAVRCRTCVGYVKRALSIKCAYVQTPDALYKYLAG